MVVLAAVSAALEEDPVAVSVDSVVGHSQLQRQAQGSPVSVAVRVPCPPRVRAQAALVVSVAVHLAPHLSVALALPALTR